MKIEKGKFLKASKILSVVVAIMLVLGAVSIFTVTSTDVTNNGAPADYVAQNDTYKLVMNFTVTTQSDTVLSGVTPSTGQILQDDGEVGDWAKVNSYDATEDFGDWNVSADSIWLDDMDANNRYQTGETVLAGVTPPTDAGHGYGWSANGCKMFVWKRIKSYDAVDTDAWNISADSIIFEGADNNTCYLDELNAVTFNLTSACNATNTDISDLTLWVETAGGGFSSSADTLLENASYSTNSNSWNISGLSQDINTAATFYVAVNLSASAVHGHEIQMEIPTKSDGGSSGSYDSGDQGLFLAGTNDTGGITNANSLTIDTFAPVTSVNVITGNYWKNISSRPLTIVVTSADNLSGLSSVSIYYYYSNDNSSWSSANLLHTESSPWGGVDYEFLFDNNSGNYRFYSIGVDNASNTETAPVTNDTECGYDLTYPNSIISIPINNSYYNSLANITGTASDTVSDILSVSITIYNSTDGNYWNGSGWQSGSSSLGCNGTTSWYYEDTAAFPTWSSSKVYIINSTSVDFAIINENTPDSNSFTYDTDNPTTTIGVPINNGYYNALNLINGSCDDTGGSGISTVNFTIYNQSSGEYWNGNAWAAGVNWSNTNISGSPYDSWSNNTASVTWANGSTYVINATAIDNASNVDGSPDSNSFLFDTLAPYSNVTPIAGYWQTSSPLVILFTAGDNGSDSSGLNDVTLYYYNSSDNSTWNGPYSSNVSTDPWNTTSWSFTFPNASSYYRFYSVATDNATNAESAPVTNDTICAYDVVDPTVTITAPVDGNSYNSGVTNITGTAYDVQGVNAVYVFIYNKTGGTYWNGSAWIGSSINLTANMSGGTPTTNWWYENQSAYPTWTTATNYTINISAKDTAGNWNSSAELLPILRGMVQ